MESQENIPKYQKTSSFRFPGSAIIEAVFAGVESTAAVWADTAGVESTTAAGVGTGGTEVGDDLIITK